MTTTAAHTEYQIKETIASCGKTKLKDLVEYGVSKYPTMGKALIRGYAKEVLESIPKEYRR
jgi:hypothetical protein